MGGTSDELWYAELNPTDQPRIEATPIDLEARIEFERTQRASLGAAGIALVGSAMESGPLGPAAPHRRGRC